MSHFARTAILFLATSPFAWAEWSEADAKDEIRFLTDGASYVGLVRHKQDKFTITNLAGALAESEIAKEMSRHGLDLQIQDVDDASFYLFLYDKAKVIRETSHESAWEYGHCLDVADFKGDQQVFLSGRFIPAKRFQGLVGGVLDEKAKAAQDLAGSSPGEISTVGLTSRIFIYGEGDAVRRTALAGSLELGEYGTILRYRHPNEAAWRVRNGHLEFGGSNGRVTAVFEAPIWKNGAACFMGESKVTGHSIFLDEVAPLSTGTKAVVEKRMLGHSFILSPTATTTSDHWFVTCLPGGKFDGDGANFSWELNQAGAFVINGLGGGPRTFSEVYIWQDGKKTYLMTPKSLDGQFRMLETL